MRRTRKLCECGRGDILLGEQARYNAKNANGKPICPSCKIEEIYDAIQTSPKADSSDE